MTMRRNTFTTAGSNALPSPSAITLTPTWAGSASAYGRWLVVVADDAAHQRADRRGVEQRHARVRVRLDQRPLVRVELAGLVEHLGRHDHLADVVQQQAHAELGEPLVDPVPAAL